LAALLRFPQPIKRPSLRTVFFSAAAIGSVSFGRMGMRTRLDAMIKPPHPGEIIKGDYLVPLGMSVNQLAKALVIGAARLNEIVRGRRGVTPDTALRLARYFGTSAEFWLNLQTLYDLRIAESETRARIHREITPLKVA
jgi:addiction module HigA family antidote